MLKHIFNNNERESMHLWYTLGEYVFVIDQNKFLYTRRLIIEPTYCTSLTVRFRVKGTTNWRGSAGVLILERWTFGVTLMQNWTDTKNYRARSLLHVYSNLRANCDKKNYELCVYLTQEFDAKANMIWRVSVSTKPASWRMPSSAPSKKTLC